MDYLPLFPLLFSFLMITLTLIFRARSRSLKLPPSPWKLPLIGNMHQLVSIFPHRAIGKLSLKYGPIMHLKLGQTDSFVISSPEMAQEIFKTHDINFSNHPKLVASSIVFEAAGALHWRQIRKIFMVEVLSAQRVKSFGKIRKAESSALVEYLTLSGNSPVNLTEKLTMLAYSTIVKASFGSGCKYSVKIISEAKMLIKLLSGFEIADLFPSLSFLGGLLGTSGKLRKIKSNIDEIMDDIIEEHILRKSTEEDGIDENLIDGLLRLKDEGGLGFPFSMSQAKALLLALFLGGTETTSTTLVWAMAELMKNPAVMEKAQAEVRRVVKRSSIEETDLQELQYMKMVLKETLRRHPPIPLMPRVNTEACNVGGFEIPAGSRVLINIWSIAMDPRYWEDVESFKPERFEGSPEDFVGKNFNFLPFGGGRRICPGIGFGLANLEMTLAHLLFHFDWKLPDGMVPEDLDMTEAFGTVMGRKLDLCLIATPWMM